jgi:hypothetical protein
VLFVLTGSSAAGKTTVLSKLAVRDGDLEVHDFDELGVPRGASPRWRQEATEEWTRRVVASPGTTRDTLIAGQTPIGEWLAVPSATALEGIAVCLLDVGDQIRAARLRQRPSAITPDRIQLGHLLAWASWHRSHAADPQWRQDVIRQGGWERMRWERWQHWQRGDRRWDVVRLDTSSAPVEETAEELARWIAERRTSHCARSLPLSGRWWD